MKTKKHERKLCVVNSHNWSSWNNFHKQVFGCFTKIIFPLRSIVGFVSKF
jgi:hypothetical protein